MLTKPKPPTDSQGKRRPVHNVIKSSDSSTPKRPSVKSGSNSVPGLDFSMFGDLSEVTGALGETLADEEDVMDVDVEEEMKDHVVMRPISSRKLPRKKVAKNDDDMDDFSSLLNDFDKVDTARKEAKATALQGVIDSVEENSEDEYIVDSSVDLLALMSSRVETVPDRQVYVEESQQNVHIKQSIPKKGSSTPIILDLNSLMHGTSISPSIPSHASVVETVLAKISPEKAKKEMQHHCHSQLYSLQAPFPSSLASSLLPVVNLRHDMTRGILFVLLTNGELNPQQLPLLIVHQKQVLGFLTLRAFVQHFLVQQDANLSVEYRNIGLFFPKNRQKRGNLSARLASPLKSYFNELQTLYNLPVLDVALLVHKEETLATVIDSLSRTPLLVCNNNSTISSKYLVDMKCAKNPTLSKYVSCFKEYAGIEWVNVVTAETALEYLLSCPEVTNMYQKDQYLDLEEEEHKDISLLELYNIGQLVTPLYMSSLIELVRNISVMPNTSKPPYVRSSNPVDTTHFQDLLQRSKIVQKKEAEFRELQIDRAMAQVEEGTKYPHIQGEWPVILGMEMLTHTACIQQNTTCLTWRDITKHLTRIYTQVNKLVRDEAAMDVQTSTKRVEKKAIYELTPTELALQACQGMVEDVASKLPDVQLQNIVLVPGTTVEQGTITSACDKLDALYSLCHCTKSSANILYTYLDTKSKSPNTLFNTHIQAFQKKTKSSNASLARVTTASSLRNTILEDMTHVKTTVSSSREILSNLNQFFANLHADSSLVPNKHIQDMMDQVKAKIHSIETQYPLFEDDEESDLYSDPSDSEEEDTDRPPNE